MPVKYRTRAYLDDPLFLINLACQKLTGLDLPSGFYSQDWKYKIDTLRGKKVATRQMPSNFVDKPLSVINYEGLDAKIMRFNLTDELNQVFKQYHNHYPIHLYYPIWDGFFRYANERNILIPSRDQQHTQYLNTYWLDNKEWIGYKIYNDTDSPIYASVEPRHRTWMSDCVYDYCCDAHNSGLYSIELNNGVLTDWDGWEFIPEILNRRHNIWRDTCEQYKRFQGRDYNNELPDPHNSIIQYTLKRVMTNIAPMMIVRFRRIRSGGYGDIQSYKWWIKTFKTDAGVSGVGDKPPNYKKVQEKIGFNFGQITKQEGYDGLDGKKMDEIVGSRQWRKLTDLMCQDRSPKIKQDTWSPYFWKGALYTSNPRQNARHPWKLGRWIKHNTDKRTNYWEKVKSESATLQSDPYYYKHKDWEKTFVSSVIKEVIAL